jgi:hypothetical protein
MWNDERDAELLRLWKTKSASQIAAQMGGTTRNAVIGRYHRIRGDYADYNAERAAAERKETMTKRRAQRDAERKAVETMQNLIALGTQRDDAIKAAVSLGVRHTVIAKALGVSRQRISQVGLS